MMTNDPTEATLLAAVCANPPDDAPRLAYADWIERHAGAEGVVRADFIRRQIRAFRVEHQISNYTSVQLDTDERHLAWCNGIAAIARRCTYIRGFAALVQVAEAPSLMRLGSELVTRAPIEYVGCDFGVKACLAELFRAPRMKHVFTLDVGGNQLDDVDMQLIADSGLDLRWLNVATNSITIKGVEALAAATAAGRFAELHTVWTDVSIRDATEGWGFGADPVVRVIGRSSDADYLRKKYGELAWLNAEPRSIIYA